MNKLQKLFETPLVKEQLYSFAKTYATIFLVLYLRDIVGESPEGGTLNLFDWTIISSALQWAFVGVLRNVYKLLTE